MIGNVRRIECGDLRKILFQFLSLVVALFAIDVNAETLTTKELVERLVERLASGNPVPDVSGSHAKYPPNFDKARQSQVFAAYEQLDHLGVAAFSELIDHLDDERYAFTADGGSKDRNFTVRHLCYHLIELQIQPDKGWTAGEGDPRFRVRRPHYPTEMNLRDKIAAGAWWEEHKMKTVRELQITVVDWIIVEEAKTPDKFPETEKSALREKQIILRASDKPYPSTIPWFK